MKSVINKTTEGEPQAEGVKENPLNYMTKIIIFLMLIIFTINTFAQDCVKASNIIVNDTTVENTVFVNDFSCKIKLKNFNKIVDKRITIYIGIKNDEENIEYIKINLPFEVELNNGEKICLLLKRKMFININFIQDYYIINKVRVPFQYCYPKFQRKQFEKLNFIQISFLSKIQGDVDFITQF
jgi:hypothetical protein